MANADHVIGFLALTVVSLSAAEVARPLRFLLVPLGLAMFVTPFVFDVSGMQIITSLAVGLVLVACSFRRGAVRERYGSWDRYIV